MDKVMEFRVPAGENNGQQMWIEDGAPWALTAVEADAALFQFRRSVKVRDQTACAMRAHELAGGLSAYLDLEAGLASVREALRNHIVDKIWPEGAPEADTPALRREMDAQLDAALVADHSREKRGLRAMNDLHARLVYLSNWPALFVDGPPGWENLSDTDVPDNLVGWIRAAHTSALVDHISGKLQPSK